MQENIKGRAINNRCDSLINSSTLVPVGAILDGGLSSKAFHVAEVLSKENMIDACKYAGMAQGSTALPPPTTALTTMDEVITVVARGACVGMGVVVDESPASAKLVDIGEGKLISTVPTLTIDTH